MRRSTEHREETSESGEAGSTVTPVGGVSLSYQEVAEVHVDLIELVCGIGTIRDVTELRVDLVSRVVENEIGGCVTGAEWFGHTSLHFDASNGCGCQLPDLSAHLSICGGWCHIIICSGSVQGGGC